MIVKTCDLKGNVKYFNVLTGKEVKIQRENPRYQNRIPDYAFALLEQSAKVLVHEPNRGSSAIGYDRKNVNTRNNAPVQRRDAQLRVSTWWQRLKNWFNSLFSNGNRN